MSPYHPMKTTMKPEKYSKGIKYISSVQNGEAFCVTRSTGNPENGEAFRVTLSTGNHEN